jgi:hypothetical protein
VDNTPGRVHFARATSDQQLRGVPEGCESQLTLAVFPAMTEAEVIAYGRSQFDKCTRLPPHVVLPIDMEYRPPHEGQDLWGFIQGARMTAPYLFSATKSPSGRWLTVVRAERRRIPMLSDLRVVNTPFLLVRPIVCVALLQTRLWEAGYEFVNRAPVWFNLPDISNIPEHMIKTETAKIAHLIGIELSSWKGALGTRNPAYAPPQILRIQPIQATL